MGQEDERRSLSKYKRSTIVGDLLPSDVSTSRKKIYFDYIVWNLNNFYISLFHRLLTLILTFTSVMFTYKQHGFRMFAFYSYWIEIGSLVICMFLLTANTITIINCRRMKKLEKKSMSYRVLEGVYKAIFLTVLGGGVSITFIYLFVLKELYAKNNQEAYMFFKEFMSHSIIPALLLIDFLFQQIVIPIKYIFWCILMNSIYLIYNFGVFVQQGDEIYMFWTNYAEGLYAGWFTIFSMLMNASLYSAVFCFSTHYKTLNK